MIQIEIEPTIDISTTAIQTTFYIEIITIYNVLEHLNTLVCKYERKEFPDFAIANICITLYFKRIS